MVEYHWVKRNDILSKLIHQDQINKCVIGHNWIEGGLSYQKCPP